MRAPVCSCGFVPGETPQPIQEIEPQEAIEKYLEDYLTILRGSDVKETLAAHIFALADAEPQTAGRLRSLKTILDDERCSSASLLDVLDDALTKELSRSLGGRVRIEKRNLNDLVIAVDEERVGAGNRLAMPSWWPMMHHQLFNREPPAESGHLENALERHYPAAGLRDKLARLGDLSLIDFIINEPFHTNAVHSACLYKPALAVRYMSLI